MIRTRLREEPVKRKYNGFFQTLRAITAKEGVRGLYGGLPAQLVRQVRVKLSAVFQMNSHCLQDYNMPVTFTAPNVEIVLAITRYPDVLTLLRHKSFCKAMRTVIIHPTTCSIRCRPSVVGHKMSNLSVFSQVPNMAILMGVYEGALYIARSH